MDNEEYLKHQQASAAKAEEPILTSLFNENHGKAARKRKKCTLNYKRNIHRSKACKYTLFLCVEALETPAQVSAKFSMTSISFKNCPFWGWCFA